MKILDGEKTKTLSPGFHVMETPDNIIINSQVYDKVSYEPVLYNFTTVQNNNRYCLLYNNIQIIDNTSSLQPTGCDYVYYLQDKYNADIFYIINYTSDDKAQSVTKISSSENKILAVNTNVGPQNYARGMKFMGQTRDYILIGYTGYLNETTGYYAHRGNTYSSIYVLSKTDLKQYTYSNYYISNYIGIYNVYFSYTFPLFDTDKYCYLMSILSYKDIQIIRYKPYDNSNTVLFNSKDFEDTKNIENISCFCQPILFRKQYVMLIRDNNTQKNYLIMFDMNEASASLYENNNIVIQHKLYELPDYNEFKYHKRVNGMPDIFTLKNINDKYIQITESNNKRQYTNAEGTETTDTYNYELISPQKDEHDDTGAIYNIFQQSDQGHHRHAIYKYDQNSDSFIGVDMIEPYTFIERDEAGKPRKQLYYGVLYYDDQTPILFGYNIILGYRFNLNTEKYEKLFERRGNFYEIGFDEYKRLYLCEEERMSVYNTLTSFTLRADFEKENYEYNNADISTYVRLYSKNFLNKYIKTHVELTLSGPCTFDSNGTKTLVTYTSESDFIDIPVTVTYGGKMQCYVKEIE